MSHYVALYRKYRPGSFAELVGQEAVSRTLASALKQDRLGHAYLFCGPRGTGKTSVARILAKSVNCKEGPTDFPCGACSNCKEITNGNNLDVIEIDAASNNGVDNIRDLQDRVALAPVTGRTKVYIIDEVHMLSQGAFNALLKTLEEPPPNVMFVLATTDPHKVLPTIVSRCQRFDFGRISLSALADRVRYVAEAEGIKIAQAGVEAIARRANGGLRDALSLLDQIAAMAAGGDVTAEQVASSLGLLSGETVCQLGRALLEGDVPTALGTASDILQAGYDHGAVMRELLAHFRHLMILQLAPERAEALDVPLAQLEELKAQAVLATAAELPWMLEVLNETEGVIRRSPQAAIWLELGLIKIAKRPPIPGFTELVERVATLERVVQGAEPLPRQAAPAPAARPQPAPPAPKPAAPPPVPHVEPAPAPAPPPPPPAEPVARPEPAEAPAPAPEPTPGPAPEPAPAGGERVVPPGAWDRVREHVRSRSVPTAALLDQQATLDRWDPDGAVVVRLAKGCKEMFEKQVAKKKLLTEGIHAVFGEGSFPRLEVGDPKKAAAKPTARPSPVVSPPPPPRTPSPPPAAVAPPVAASASAPPVDDGPPLDEPPDWLDELDAPPPPEETGMAVAAPAAPVARGAGSQDDPALKLAVELFNGRVISPPDSPAGWE